MTHSIEIPFALGEQVWSVPYGGKQVSIECPECVGTRVCTIILGNGETHTLACRGCGTGYDKSTGRIKRWVYDLKPEPFTPRRVRMDRPGEFMYSEASPDAMAYSSRPSDRMFATYAEANAECAVVTKRLLAANAEREVRGLASKREDLAWSVHYWGRQVAEYKRKLEVTQARLAMSKERKKENA
ncbi:MAG: hypothetical protein GY946_01045 [bacterium]|nr:hypothetical protein [bacterium]